MSMQDRDVWRYAGARRLMGDLMVDEAIARWFASPIDRHACSKNRVLFVKATGHAPDGKL